MVANWMIIALLLRISDRRDVPRRGLPLTPEDATQVVKLR
jgi:hypothetical protein